MISDTAFAFIEGLQPYYGRHHGHHLLRLLGKLSNIDKHRRPNVTVCVVDDTQIAHGEGGAVAILVRPGLQQGAELPPFQLGSVALPGDVKMERQFPAQVAFNEPDIGRPAATPLNEVIHGLPTFIMWTVLPGFRHLYENP